uniref:SH3 domain-containing protein n=1 Tax=Arion vulgaris TaxID=1028688 RepID=A0A0B7BH78_9EUPU
MADCNVLSTLNLILLLLLFVLTFVSTQISDKRLCADKECEEVISKGAALGTHRGDHPLLLSFQLNDVISITSKSAGKNPHLWGGEVNGQKGYFDKNYVREFKVLVENPQYEVDTEGDVFERLGKPKPPSADRQQRRQVVHIGEIKTDVAEEEKRVKAEKDKLVRSNSAGHEDEDLHEGDRSQKEDLLDDLLKRDDNVGHLKNENLQFLLKKDEADLSDTDDLRFDKKESVDDNDDYEEKESAELNQFLKKKLSSADTDGADSVGSREYKEHRKMESETAREDKTNRNVDTGDVDKQEHSSKSVDQEEDIYSDYTLELPQEDSKKLTENVEGIDNGLDKAEDSNSNVRDADGIDSNLGDTEDKDSNLENDEDGDSKLEKDNDRGNKLEKDDDRDSKLDKEDDRDSKLNKDDDVDSNLGKDDNRDSNLEKDDDRDSNLHDTDDRKRPSKSQSVKDDQFASNEDDFDPTEIDETSPSEVDEENGNDVKNVDSEHETKINIKGNKITSKEHISEQDSKDLKTDKVSDDEQAISRTSEHSQKEKNLSQEEKSVLKKTGLHDSDKTSKENLAEEIEVKADSKEKQNKKSSLPLDSTEGVEENDNSSIATDKAHDLEETAESNEEESIGVHSNKEDRGKSFVNKNKQDDHKVHSGDKDVNKFEKDKTINSKVGSDTSSDTLSTKSNQVKDSITPEKTELDSEPVGSHKHGKVDRKDELLGLKRYKIVSSEEPDRNLNHFDKEFNEKNKENRNNLEFNSEVDQINSEDQDKPSDDDFVSFLQSSGTEPKASDLVTETPKLNTNPTAAFIEDRVSDSSPLKFVIESSKTSDHKLDATEDSRNKKVHELEGETIVEGGSTIILDKKGNLITAIMPEGQTTQESDEIQPPLRSESTTNPRKINPTAVDNIPKPSEALVELNEKVSKKDVDPLLQSYENDINLNNTQVRSGNNDALLDNHFASEYKSSDFNSRNLLSVNQPPATSQRHQHQLPPTAQQQPSEEERHQDSVVPTPALHLSLTQNSEIRSEIPDILAETYALDADDTKDSPPFKDLSSADDTAKQTLPDQDDPSDELEQALVVETTNPITDSIDTPPSSNIDEPTPEDNNTPSEDYDSVYHNRKITDENLLNEEEHKFAEHSQGFFKRFLTNLERHFRELFEKLPPNVLSVLEPFTLVPNIKLLVVTFVLAMLISTSLISCCFSGGTNKKKQREMLVQFDDMEKKRLIDLKEKQNLEDEIISKVTKNAQMKVEITKLTEESKKNKFELETIQLHNETLKKQLTSLQEQVGTLKTNANSKQGEAKQQNKKTKDLEKQIKKLEEREINLEQTAQKLTSDLKHKEEEASLLTSKVTSLTNQVGHLQISKDQLLAEAEDWKEKVLDLKERLEQREEEFKQMQETIMFKENELEVLKDCFLQLKSFEEKEEEGENTEDASDRVQEKIASMMNVSKMNASFQALEEEKNSLTNKLDIEIEARRELEEQLESSRRSVESSMADKMKAERQCQEAQTKLSVLSSYFKEKEMQLQRELGEQEALKKQNQNKLVSADETTKSAQQELDLVREQNESLKRELTSSERDFRSQIAANEKKAHENWLSARAAERELKEARHEAGVLRQKLTDIERRQFMGPGGLIRPLPTRGIPPAGVMNGPPPPGMDRSPSRGSLPLLPPLHMRDDDFLPPSHGERGPPPFSMDLRRPPLPPPGMRPLPPDGRSPPPRVPPFSGGRSPPLRMPPPGMMDRRSPPPYDRRPLPHHMMDRRSPPFRHPPPDMLPPHLRGGPLPPPHLAHVSSGSPTMGPDSPRIDGRYPLPPYGRNPPPSLDRPSPKQGNQTSPRQQQSQV